MVEPPDVPRGFVVGPPAFVGIGTQKSGTSWWYSLIAAHPEVHVARGMPKELQFFFPYFDRPFGDEDVDRYHRYFPRPSSGGVTGEWSPRYLHDFWTLPLLRQAAPDAQLLVLLRDPVHRYESGVTQTVEAMAKRQQGRHASGAGEGAGISALHANDACHRGLYHAALERWVAAFGESRLLVLQYERCCEDPLAELKRTFAFLGLGDVDFVPPGVDKAVGPRRTERAPVPDHVRDALREYYAEDVRLLARQFPELDLALWPNFADVA